MNLKNILKKRRKKTKKTMKKILGGSKRKLKKNTKRLSKRQKGGASFDEDRINKNIHFYVARFLTRMWIRRLPPEKKLAVAKYIINIIFDPNGPKPNESRLAGVICGICNEKNSKAIIKILHECELFKQLEVHDLKRFLDEMEKHLGCNTPRTQQRGGDSKGIGGALEFIEKSMEYNYLEYSLEEIIRESDKCIHEAKITAEKAANWISSIEEIIRE